MFRRSRYVSPIRCFTESAIDPKRTFPDPHASLYDTFNLQPHLIRRPTQRHLWAAAHRNSAAATAAV